MSHNHEQSSPTTRVTSHGPGPFVTHRVAPHPDGGFVVAHSRRHRKGLRPHRAASVDAALRMVVSRRSAFGHFVGHRRMAWWIAVLFMIGAAHFFVASIAGLAPGDVPAALRSGAVQGWVYFVGSWFFTCAAYLQWLESMNRDVLDALVDAKREKIFTWWAWRPRNLGFLACIVQLAGTILFNFNTGDSLFARPGAQSDVFVWTPNMLGSVCFLAASVLAFLEVTCGRIAIEPRSVSWWIAVINLAGSVAFQVSALVSFEPLQERTELAPVLAGAMTAAGAACFFVGAYLMIPEMFDEAQSDERSQDPAR